MDRKQFTANNNNASSTLNSLINSKLHNNGAHILYMFNEYDKYINNAVPFIAEGIDKGHTIVLIENCEFIRRLNNNLLRLGYSQKDLDAIIKMDYASYYSKNKNFEAQRSSDSLKDLLEPYIDSKITTRLWGKVLAQGVQVTELREYECMCDEYVQGKNIISVCTYNALVTPAYIQNEMLKVHDYFMLDERVELSPFYHKTNSSAITYQEKNRLQNMERENISLMKKNEQLRMEKDQEIVKVQLLREEKTSAENANKMKNTFLSQMSHDLRTPLNTILGYTQILLLEENNTDSQHSLGKIYDSSMDLLKLIEEIIDFSAIEAGKISLHIEDIHVKSFVENCVHSIFETQSAKIVIKIDSISDDLYITADKLRLQQVITNLISNGMKYNKENGEVSIFVDYNHLEKSVKISVKDSGIGIPHDELVSIFKPFYRTKVSLEQWKGSGVGLAIVSKLTNKMNGSYGVMSEEDIGSTFWVTFDGFVEKKAPSHSMMPINRDQHIPSLSGKLKILYIEDNVDNIEVLSSMLQVIGDITFTYETAGEQGFAKAVRIQPDLILLDLHLPDVSGLSILAKLKAHSRTKDIPVVVVSAEAIESTIKLARKEGCQNYLMKPVDMNKLREVIWEHSNSK
ncbi:ATP-binding protein [Evansella sp. AB-rgal1]|uniref:ATP-binding protein n=1 Tax=Evansella sp. AB-rgal1 TaxID=3242696 RepID=UPI00359E15EA